MTANVLANGLATSPQPTRPDVSPQGDLPTLSDIRTMRAAVLVEQRRPLELADITLPTCLEPGQVLVRVHYSGVCGSQVGEIDGVRAERTERSPAACGLGAGRLQCRARQDSPDGSSDGYYRDQLSACTTLTLCMRLLLLLLSND